jgi:hypothetical protein
MRRSSRKQGEYERSIGQEEKDYIKQDLYSYQVTTFFSVNIVMTTAA